MTRLALAGAITIASLTGCNSLLGVEDVSLRPDGGGDTVDASTTDGATDAAVDAALPVHIGNDTPFGGQTDVLASFDLARQIQVTSATNLRGFGVVTKAAGGAGGMLRMGLYVDSANEPVNFVARSAVISDFAAGTVIADITPTPIAVGTYWIAIAFNADTAIGANSANLVPSCFAMRTDFDNAIPTSGFDVPTCNDADELNLFIVVDNQ